MLNEIATLVRTADARGGLFLHRVPEKTALSFGVADPQNCFLSKPRLIACAQVAMSKKLGCGVLVFSALTLACGESPTDGLTARVGEIDCGNLPVLEVESNVPFEGTDAPECIVGTNGDDIIDGGGGDDVILAGNGNDQVEGGAGDDQIDGGNGSDTLIGGRGNDVLRGGNAEDVLDGGPGDDDLGGGNGEDTLSPCAGADVVAGGKGNDIIVVGALCETELGDVFDGGKGNDELVSPSGSGNVLLAGATLDSVEGDTIDDSGEGSADCTTTDEVVGPEGGTVETPGGEATIVVPAGAVDENVVISVAEPEPEVADTFPEGTLPGTLELGPEGVEFDTPLTIAFEAPEAIVAQVGLENLAVVTLENGEWVSVPSDPNYADGGPNTVTGVVTHFSYWGVGTLCNYLIDANAPGDTVPREASCDFAALCGDGVVGLGEMCDDGDDNNGLSECSDTCTCDAATYTFGGNGCTCGDGIVDIDNGEACDDGGIDPNNDNTDADPNKCSRTCGCDVDMYDGIGSCAGCGDGSLDEGLGEECDQGDTDPDDGCSPVCKCEPLVRDADGEAQPVIFECVGCSGGGTISLIEPSESWSTGEAEVDCGCIGAPLETPILLSGESEPFFGCCCDTQI